MQQSRVCLVAIGRGNALFGNVQEYLELKLLSTRTLNSGAVLHDYRAA
jgi:hypothetical protein